MRKIISILLSLSILSAKQNKAEISYSAGDKKVKRDDIIIATSSDRATIMQEIKSDSVTAMPLSLENLTEQYLALNPKTLKTLAAVLYRNIPSVSTFDLAIIKGVNKELKITDEEKKYHAFLSAFISLSTLNSQDIELWRALPLVQEFEKTLFAENKERYNQSLAQIVEKVIIDYCEKIGSAVPVLRNFFKEYDYLSLGAGTLYTIPLEDFESSDSVKCIYADISSLDKLDNNTLKNLRTIYMGNLKNLSTLYDLLLEKFNTQIRDEFNATVSSSEDLTRENSVYVAISSFINDLSMLITFTDDMTAAILNMIRSIDTNALLMFASGTASEDTTVYNTFSADWLEGKSVLRNISLKQELLSKLKTIKVPAAIINKISNDKALDNISVYDECSAILDNVTNAVIRHERAKLAKLS